MKAYHGQAWWWGMAVILSLMLSACYTEVSVRPIRQVPVYRYDYFDYSYPYLYRYYYYPMWYNHPTFIYKKRMVEKTILRPDSQKHRTTGQRR